MELVSYILADLEKIGLLRRHRLNVRRVVKGLGSERYKIKRTSFDNSLVLYFGVFLLYPI